MCIAKNKKLMARIKSVTLARPLKSSSFCIIVTIKIRLFVLYLNYIIICACASSFLRPKRKVGSMYSCVWSSSISTEKMSTAPSADVSIRLAGRFRLPVVLLFLPFFSLFSFHLRSVSLSCRGVLPVRLVVSTSHGLPPDY